MTLAGDRAAGLALMREMVVVSRETEARFDIYAGLLARWQKAKNLVAPDALNHLWTRHFADSAQALAVLPDARHWVDLGSGAGLPGLVVAILLADRQDVRVDLVESNARKCAFLRTVARETGAPARVHAARIGDFIDSFTESPDAITARALAPLVELVGMAAPLIARGAVGLFHKGQDVESELTEASRYWKIDVELRASRTHPRGSLVIVRDCWPKSA